VKRRQAKSQAGLTLVELIVALSAACIVLCATAIILIFGQNSLSHEWQQVNLQRDASYAMLRMKQSIRCATNAQVEESGKGVKIYNRTGWIRFWYIPGQKDILWQLKDGEPQTLLDGVVESATFVIDGATVNAVTVDIDLKRDGCEAKITSTTMMRNYGT
jgi:prepilin-type N-terminal cleavage/methylation domain-containing protein